MIRFSPKPSAIELPDDLKRAQQAVALPEVQAMMKELAKYNLGVCMPHMHSQETGQFALLPQDMAQVEDDLRVSFLPVQRIAKLTAIPVAWRWLDNGVESFAACSTTCIVHTSQSGGEEHCKYHSRE